MKKSKMSNVLLVAMLIIGLFLLLYPPISNYWNSLRQSYAISSYSEEISKLDSDKYQHIWDGAVRYNRSLVERSNKYLLSEEQKAEYDKQLNLIDTGMMGQIEIPLINCSLPIYHGTSEAVLQMAVGHLEWSSLPVGGESSHCVLSGHRGLPTAQLFTHLDQLMVGDVFILRVLDEVLTYEVDQILIVLPHETDSLVIEEGKDLCTLITCTPYGINSHRLLVRGHRVENAEEARLVRVSADAIQIEPVLVAPIVAMPILLILLIRLMMPGHKKTKPNRKEVFVENDNEKET